MNQQPRQGHRRVGRPPLRLPEDIAAARPVEEQKLIAGSLQVGLAIDE